MKLNVSFMLEMWTSLEVNMKKLLKILFPFCVCGIFTLSGTANADPLSDITRVYNLIELTKTVSLLKQLGARWESKAQYLPTPVIGRNKYGLPVPDPVKTAHEGERKPAYSE